MPEGAKDNSGYPEKGEEYMATKFDVPVNVLIEKTAAELKKLDAVKAPEWASYVKTGGDKERSPTNDDWWYMRSASVLRKISLKGPIGVSKLRVLYGGRKNRGMRPEHFRKASGNIIRKILQQLEKAGLAVQKTVNKYYGRVATPKGISLLDKTAHAIAKELKVEEMHPIVVDVKKVRKKISQAPPKKKSFAGFRDRGRRPQQRGPPRRGAPRRGRR